MFLAFFIFFRRFKPWCSHKKSSYKKKSVYIIGSTTVIRNTLILFSSLHLTLPKLRKGSHSKTRRNKRPHKILELFIINLDCFSLTTLNYQRMTIPLVSSYTFLCVRHENIRVLFHGEVQSIDHDSFWITRSFAMGFIVVVILVDEENLDENWLCVEDGT